MDSDICKIHNQMFQKVCIQDKTPLCNDCLKDHPGHQIRTPNDLKQEISQTISKMEPDIQKKRQLLGQLHLPKTNEQFVKALQELEGAKQELKNLIEEYFKDVKETFMILYTKYPSEDAKSLCDLKLESILGEFNIIKHKLNQTQLTAFDAANFLEQDYLFVNNELKFAIDNLESYSKNNKDNTQVKNDQFPFFRINKNAVEKLMFNLHDFVTPVMPGNLPRDMLQAPHINNPSNHNFDLEISKLAILNDQTRSISYYDIKQGQQFYDQINCDLPYQPTVQFIDNHNLIVTGGVYQHASDKSRSEISGKVFLYSINTKSFTSLPDMLVKRVGHSLVYIPGQNLHQSRESIGGIKQFQDKATSQVLNSASQFQNQNHNINNQQQHIQSPSFQQQKYQQLQNQINLSAGSTYSYIYAIGGRTNDKIRTKLCERYNLTTRGPKWEKVAPLNFARSRCSACVFDTNYIYAFYGTNSFGKSVPTIEKLDIRNNQWEQIEIYNHLPGFDITCATSVQINPNQILILGGFRDSMFFDADMIMNRKLISYNVSTNTVSLFELSIPVDFISQSSFVYNNEVYCVGGFMNEFGKFPKQNLDSYYVMKINYQSAQVITVLNIK